MQASLLIRFNLEDLIMQPARTDVAPTADALALDPTTALASTPSPIPPEFAPAPAFTNHQQTNVNVTVGMPAIQFNAAKQGHSIFVRALWFLAIGWWLSGVFITLGYLLTLSVVLLPVGLWFLNRVPQAQTLRARTRQFTTEFRDNAIVFTEGNKQQVAWYLRLLYLPVGLVLGLVWLALAWIVSLTIVGLPLSIMMIDRAPAVITLQRH
jgi:uncharacterized membrane protein YccF (DUF307 family)